MDVSRWLQLDTVNLPRYKQTFNDLGYDTTDDIIDLKYNDLTNVFKITKPGHCQRIFKAIKVLKKVRQYPGRRSMWKSRPIPGSQVDVEKQVPAKDETKEAEPEKEAKDDNIEAPEITLDPATSTMQSPLQADDTDYGTRFEEVTNIGGSGANAKPISALTDMERRKLIHNVKILCGRSFSHSAHGDGGVDIKTWPIFEIKDGYKDLSVHFTMDTKLSFVSSTTFDSNEAKMSVHGYSNTSASASVAGGGFGVTVEASVSASSSDSHTNTNKNKSEVATDIVKGLYPRGTIELDSRCVVLTEQFKEDLKHFLDADLDEKDDIDFRQEFRERYGYWVDLKVQVGGKIFSTRTRKSDNITTDEQHQRDFKASVSAKVSSPWAGGGAAASHGDGGGDANLAAHVKEMSELHINSIGGENTTVSQTDWSKWQESVGSCYEMWAVININKTCDVLSLKRYMDDEYYSEIKDVYDAYQPAANIANGTLRMAEKAMGKR